VRVNLFVILLSGLLGVAAQSEPYFDGRKQELTYPGPGRDEPPPQGLTEVRIGYFGPSDAHHQQGGDLWVAAQLAVEEANASGGYRGLPFRLAPAWSESPWGSGIAQMTRLIYTEGVWALIGGIDGASTHLAEQVTTKARLALVSPVSSDKTVNYAYVPWAFSVSAADNQLAAALAPALERMLRGGRLVIVSANDHDSQMAVREFKSVLATSVTPALHVQFQKGAPDVDALVGEIQAAGAQAVLLVADPSDSAAIVLTLRANGCSATIFGAASMARREFLEKAGLAAEGVVFPVPAFALSASPDFTRRFSSRAGHAPDFAACQTYDVTRLLIQAIRKAGLNRPLIRDAIRSLSGWTGVSGAVCWDPVGQNRATVKLATVREGVVTALAL
jgi:branched-chain amino acid transport system substrate-binding protein